MRTQEILKVSVIAWLCVGLLCSVAAAFEETIWIGGVGDWSDAANWDNGEPTASVYWTEVFNGGTALVTQPDEECDWLYLDGSSEIRVMTGGLLDVNGSLNIGGGGELTLDGGSVTSQWTDVGDTGAGTVSVNGPGSSWTCGYLALGPMGTGTLAITGGGSVTSGSSVVGQAVDSTVSVDGTGSSWTCAGLTVGFVNAGTLAITDGGAVTSGAAYLGDQIGSTGTVTVDGAGSSWTNSDDLWVGFDDYGFEGGDGTLNITGGGLVSVAGILTIDADADGDGFINMATYGMLALSGDADDSLADFLGLIDGTDAIRYWNDDLSAWDDIASATMGVDYRLAYLTEGDLSGYTMLTVPEPTTVSLLALGGLALVKRRRR